MTGRLKLDLPPIGSVSNRAPSNVMKDLAEKKGRLSTSNETDPISVFVALSRVLKVTLP